MQMNQSIQSFYEVFAKNLIQINIWFNHGRTDSPIWLKVNRQIKKNLKKSERNI